MLTLCPECSARVPLSSGVGPVGSKTWTCPAGHTWGHEGKERRHYARLAHLAGAAEADRVAALCATGCALVLDSDQRLRAVIVPR
jgi:hypothetical protein